MLNTPNEISMLDAFDYKETACATCGGKEFYNPKQDAPIGTIPIKRIIEKLDNFFDCNNMQEAGKLLEYWQKEALALKDLRGELSITDELIGYYRKVCDIEKGLIAVDRAIELISVLGLQDSLSAGTIFLNCATTKKAFGQSHQALPLYDQALELYTKLLPPNDEKFAGFYNNKGLALADLKRFEEAEKCFQKAIEIGNGLEDGSVNVALTYINLAHLYEQSKRTKRDIDVCLLKAYNLLFLEGTKKDGDYAYACSKCAPSYEYFGYQKIADELNKEAEKIYASNGNL